MSRRDVDDHATFVELLGEMERCGCAFVVHDSDHVEVTNAERIPEWCDQIIEHWADYVICVHAFRQQGGALVICSVCSELYLLTRGATGSPCAMKPCAGTRSIRPPISFRPPERTP